MSRLQLQTQPSTWSKNREHQTAITVGLQASPPRQSARPSSIHVLTATNKPIFWSSQLHVGKKSACRNFLKLIFKYIL